MRLALAFAAIALWFAPQVAAAQVDPSPADRPALERSMKRGLALWQYDQAAWHTTDALMKAIRDPGGAGIRGWVVTPVPDGWRVTYYGVDGDRRFGIWSAVWTGSAVQDARRLGAADAALDADQLRLIAAKEAAPVDRLMRCGKAPFNTVVLPGEGPDAPVSVYFLTPQTQAGQVPLGGHTLIEMRDGAVVSRRDFARSCIELGAQADKKGKAAAMVVSHLMDPVPTEIHVFSVYAARLPLFVITAETSNLWEVGIKDGKPQILLIKRGGK